MQRTQLLTMALVGDVGVVAAVAIFVMNDKQHHTQEEAHRAHRDVGNAQEGVLAPHPRDGAKDHTLAALKASHRVIVGDLQGVVASRQGRSHAVFPLDDAVKFAEGGERSRSHPDNEVLIDEAVVLLVNIQLIHVLVPIDRLGGALKTGC